MKNLRMKKRAVCTGFTLVEVSVATAIVAILAFALVSTLQMGDHTIDTVQDVTEVNAESREVMRRLIEDFQVTNDSRITVQVLPDNNHQVTFMMPIELSGNLTWGVFDEGLGANPDQQTQENWKVRYTTFNVIEPDGINRQLVRQILDLTDTVQLQETVVEYVRNGTDNPPGFQMVKNGDMWEVTLSTFGEEADDPANVLDFQVWARN